MIRGKGKEEELTKKADREWLMSEKEMRKSVPKPIKRTEKSPLLMRPVRQDPRTDHCS